jgi:hypothetical protein
VYQYTRKTGRPRKYSSPRELEEVVELYFNECDKQGRPYTVTGLALALGVTRDQLLKYQVLPEFEDTIKRAKQRVAACAEEQLYRKGGQVAGIIFSLKNNFGWKDSFENTNVNIDTNDLLDRIEKASKPIRLIKA